MGIAELTELMPQLVVAVTAVVALALLAVRRTTSVTISVTLAGLAAALASLAVVEPTSRGTMVVLDASSRLFVGLLLAGALAVAALCSCTMHRYARHLDELYVLLLLGTLGAAVVASSSHFASFVLGLELLTVSLYALIAYLVDDRRSIEAGIKYLILGGAASATLLFGAALVYVEVGTLDLGAAAQTLASRPPSPLALCGLGLVFVGVGFKLAAVPFHMWTADVYEGAPAPVTAFIATVSKGAVVAVLVRHVMPWIGAENGGALVVVLVVVAALSMLVGNLLALRQKNLKRLLAYSSIAHMGYLLVAILAGGVLAVQAVAYYLAAYFLATVIAFGAVAMQSPAGRDRAKAAAHQEADHLDDFRGLFWERPALAAALVIALFSLAGLPITGGFVGKLYVLSASMSATLFALSMLLVLTSVVGLYYYLRVVVVMIAPQADRPSSPGRRSALAPGMGLLAVLTSLLVVLGVLPEALTRAARDAARDLPTLERTRAEREPRAALGARLDEDVEPQP